MPLPVPSKKENKDEFISRCMADDLMNREYANQKQRYAVCQSQWERKNMKNFKGFNDWIEIFSGGEQTDSNGVKHDGDVIIKKAIETFNTAEHEPPLVVGHPKDNAPAYGWVEGLKEGVKNGKRVLLAKFKQVVSEFEDMVQKGLFKKRSASFYPDGRLRHVGFLGAAPPAVKGLADLKFEDDGSSFFEFANDEDNSKANNTGGDKMKFSDFLEIFKFWKQVKDDPDIDLSGLEPVPVKNAKEDDNMGDNYTEEDIKKAREEAAKLAKEEAIKEFQEAEKAKAAEAAKAAISDWCDQKVKEGKIVPAWVKGGLKDFMECLIPVEDEISFSEDKKGSAIDWFKQFIDELPKAVEFKEIATRDKDVKTGNAEAKLDQLTRDRMKEKSLSYSQAFAEIQVENPDLVEEYIQNYS